MVQFSRVYTALKKKHSTKDLEYLEDSGHDCSYDALDALDTDPKKGFTTKWGPVKFTKENHPLSIMVRL